VISAVLFNILVMFINWVHASRLASENGPKDIFTVFLPGILVISGAALLTLTNSKHIYIRCHQALE